MKINIPEFEARVKTNDIRKFTTPEYPGLIGWCYTKHCQFENHWDEYTILARGIVTNEDGTAINRPFPKFFNLGEHGHENDAFNWNEEIEVTEKIDGSLIIVTFYNHQMIVNSKGSFTSEHARFAKKWIDENLSKWAEQGKAQSKPCAYTYLFEAVFPVPSDIEVKVINYGDRADLTLLAIINTSDGSEYSYAQLNEFAQSLQIPLAPRYEFTDKDAFITAVRARPTIQEGEGLVLRFTESGKRVKVKSNIYLLLHRLISGANRKAILTLLIEGKDIEEIYAPLPDEFYNDVKGWVVEFKTEYKRIQDTVAEAAIKVQAIDGRKEQARIIYQNPKYAEIRGLIFTAVDGYDISQNIWAFMKKRLVQENKEKRLKEIA